MLGQRTIVIQGDRIQEITKASRTPQIAGAPRIIDARGKYVIPGLIDAHAHVVTVLDSAHVTGEEILPLFLANGITSLRDTGDEIVAEKLIARYAGGHPDRCPRIFLCSPLIDSNPAIHPANSWSMTDPAKVSAFAQDMTAWGAITLKIYAGTERSVGRKVIEEGHRQSMIVTAHLGKYSAQDAVADGIDCLEHIISVFNYCFPPDAPLDAARDQAAGGGLLRILKARADLDLESPTARELVASLVKQKVMIDPTLVVFRNMLLLPELPEISQDPDYAFVPSQLRRAWRQYLVTLHLPPPQSSEDLRERIFRRYQQLTGILYRAGVPLLVGTDSPCPYVPPGFAFHRELELLVESGLTPAAALQAATIHGAQILKQGDRLGSIEEGKLADLVILDANPLADIRNTQKIYRVINRGLVVDPQALLTSVRYDRDHGYPPYLGVFFQQ
jgi:hypothetical protein